MMRWRNTENFGSNTPVLAIHGSAATGKQWDSLRTSCGEEREILAPDLAGYGEELVTDEHDQPGLADRAQPLLRLLRHQQRPVHVVAHSFGAAIALELVRVLPQAVRSLWLYEPIVPALLQHGGTDRDLALRADLGCLADMLDRASDEVGMAAFVDFWHGAACWSQLPDSRQALLAGQAAIVLRDFREAFAQAAPVHQLQRHPAAVHIAVGEKTRTHATRMASILDGLLPNSSFARFADMGHMGPCTHTEIINQAIMAWIHQVETGCSGSDFPAPMPASATA